MTTELVVTTIDGKQVRVRCENDSLISAAESIERQGHIQAVVVSHEPGRTGRETKAVFYKHAIISISDP